MVKSIRNLLVFSFLILAPLCAQVAKKPNNPCNSEVVQKARKDGFRSLKLMEKIQFYRDLKKCEDKVLAKSIKKEVNAIQLKTDAENSKLFVGRTSGCAYCVIALFVYLLFS
jgi:hypothetical protein|tara:strand:+ start:12429 stop:12764 length:336 start_codon:yes stop_codon:yes gene_type:complete